jgi:hypothetical protein
MNTEGVITCKDCGPPSVEKASGDSWTCNSCHLKFRLDRETRTWWPEAWWELRDKQMLLSNEEPMTINLNSGGLS